MMAISIFSISKFIMSIFRKNQTTAVTGCSWLSSSQSKSPSRINQHFMTASNILLKSKRRRPKRNIPEMTKDIAISSLVLKSECQDAPDHHPD